MIGKVIKDGKVIAILNDQGEWECQDKITLYLLQTHHSPSDSTKSQLGFPFGMLAVTEAARALGGKPVLTQAIPQAEPGILY